MAGLAAVPARKGGEAMQWTRRKRVVAALACALCLLGLGFWVFCAPLRVTYAFPLRADLHNIGLAIHEYRKDHDGNPPEVLDEIVREGYLWDASILKPEGKQIVYRPLRADAPAEEVLAYYWPPWVSGTAGNWPGFLALYNDGPVSWVTFEEPDAVSAAKRVRTRTEATRLEDIMREVGQEISAYRKSHAGAWPATITDRGKQIRERSAGTGKADVGLVYRAPWGKGFREVMAYFWPPVYGGTAVLFRDYTVCWLPAGTDGDVLNPWTGKSIRAEEGGDEGAEPAQTRP